MPVNITAAATPAASVIFAKPTVVIAPPVKVLAAAAAAAVVTAVAAIADCNSDERAKGARARAGRFEDPVFAPAANFP